MQVLFGLKISLSFISILLIKKKFINRRRAVRIEVQALLSNSILLLPFLDSANNKYKDKFNANESGFKNNPSKASFLA